MKVLIIGCGAVGLSVASALYISDVVIDIIARGETAEAIRKNGIERCGVLGNVTVPPNKIRVFEKIEDAGGGYDFIINSAKTTGNADIAESLAVRKDDIISPGGLVVLFQNGYGNELKFTDVFEKQRIIHASLTIGFRRPKAFVSEVTVFKAPIAVGSLFGQTPEGCRKLAEAIERGGIPCSMTNEIGKTLWAKLLYNCALNPLSAILGSNYGGLIKSESSISLMEGIIDEIFAVMRAGGYETFWEDAETYKKEFFEKILPPTYEHRSSTLQDIERKIPTEIDSLNGAVVRMGEKLKIETPCNTVITKIIKSMEGLYDLKSY